MIVKVELELLHRRSMEMSNRFEDIIRWAEDRNLIHGSTTEKQFLKLSEEAGELAAGMARGLPAKVKDLN